MSAEGSLEGIDQALAAREAGADAILLMPPHHWLRFGRSTQTAVGFFEDVASAGVDIVVHQYPAWTKAGYSLISCASPPKSDGHRSTGIALRRPAVIIHLREPARFDNCHLPKAHPCG